MRRNEIIALFIVGVILAIVLSCLILRDTINVAQAIEITITFVLVCVTAIYVIRTAEIAKATKEQAEASKEMAEEMREQRRPIIVPEVVPFKVITPITTKIDYTRGDIFKIRNVGNGPAIELEIVQLDKDKGLPQVQKKAILSQVDEPLPFYPVDLANQEKTTCYLVCQYRSVLSPKVLKIWHQTWLPFTPKKSQSGERIIIIPHELEFRRLIIKNLSNILSGVNQND